MYETKRNKPGLKPGALENVHRRLGRPATAPYPQSKELTSHFAKDVLERVTQRLDSEARNAGRHAPLSEGPETRACSVLALLARELPKLLEGDSSVPISGPVPVINKKRRRTDQSQSVSGVAGGYDSEEDGASSPALPPPHALDMILDAYFVCIHPWIPMIHQTRFRSRLSEPRERPKLNVVLHAMVLAASKFVRDQECAVPKPDRLRSWVVSTAMDCMSVESLQAMVILSFADVSVGRPDAAPPLQPIMCSVPDTKASLPRLEVGWRPGLGLLSGQ